MPAPWEKYAAPAAAPPAASGGPWAKYSQPAPEQAAQEQPAARAAEATAPAVDKRPPGDLYSAIAEPLTTMATGTVGTIAGGLAGLGAAATKAAGLTQAEPGDVVRNVSSALTYQPRTKAGSMVNNVISYIPDKFAQGADWAGGKTAELTGSPAVGAAVNTAIQAAPAILARRATVKPNGNPVANPPRPAAQVGEVAKAPDAPAPVKRAGGLESVSKAAPSLEELTALRKDAYKRADESGIVVQENSVKGVKTRLAAIAKKEGLNSKLHPDSHAALQEVLKSKGNLTLTEVETLRKIANDAKASIKPADGRIGGKIVDEIDDYLDNLSDKDVLAGTPEKAKVLSEARSLYAREKRSQTIARLMDRAETKAGAHYTQAGMEHAIRGEFKSLALNDKELRRFSKEEQAAIKNIARGGKWENSLRNLGKFDPSSGGMAAFMSTLLAGGGAAATGGASLALPAAAFIAKRQATKVTARKVAALDEMVRGGSPPAPKRNKLAEVKEF